MDGIGTAKGGHRKTLSECLCALVVFGVFSCAGWVYLEFRGGPPFLDYNSRDGSAFLPALMYATGHDFSEPAFNRIHAPGIDDFLQRKTMRWDAANMPADVPSVRQFGKFTLDRYYLLWLVAVTWRLLGVSWTVLNLPVAAAFGAMAMLMYGIFRLGAGRLLSGLATAIAASAPLTLFYLPSMRDFFRGPPILAVLFFCGYLASRRVSRKRFLLVSALAGLTVGVGFGFRQDAIVCLFPLLVTQAFFSRGRPAFGVGSRIGAALISLAAFLGPAYPMLTMTYNSGGNNSFYLMQGYAGDSLQRLHLGDASYLPLFSTSDFVTHAQICDFESMEEKEARARWNHGLAERTQTLQARSLCAFPAQPVESAALFLAAPFLSRSCSEPGLTIWGKQAEHTARRMFLYLLRTYPADFIARWYAATAAALRNSAVEDFGHTGMANGAPVLETLQAFHEPLIRHLGKWGIGYAVAALALLAALDLRMALAAVFFLFYFAGYPSLSYQWRAAFHLQFLALWAPAFLLASLASTAWTSIGAIRRASLPASWKHPRHWALPAMTRIAILAFLCAAGIGGPLYAARIYQSHTAATLLDTYSRAEIEPVPSTPLEWTNTPASSVIHALRPETAPIEPAPPRPMVASLFSAPVDADIVSEYYMLEFEAPPGYFALGFKYKENVNFDFLNFYQVAGEHPETCRFFFPAYYFPEEYRRANRPATFSTLDCVYAEGNVTLKGLYRVKNKRDFPILMTVFLPENRDEWKYWFSVFH